MSAQGVQDVKNRIEQMDMMYGFVGKVYFARDSLLGRIKHSHKKSIWLAESENTTYEKNISGAISWTLTLGYAAQHGYHTILHHMTDISQPSPDYWVSLLHHNIVGKTALGTTLWPQDPSVTVFTQCTAVEQRPTLNTEWEYDAGAVTVWGVNSGPNMAQLNLRIGTLIKFAHLYFLTQEADGKGRLLLNGQPLQMVHGVLPRISPRIRAIIRNPIITVPAYSVFFIVLPDVQAPACGPYPSKMDSLRRGLAPLTIDIPLNSSLKILFDSSKKDEKSDGYVLEKGGIFKDMNSGGRVNENINENKSQIELQNNPEIDILERPRSDVEKNTEIVFKSNKPDNSFNNDFDYNKNLESSKENVTLDIANKNSEISLNNTYVNIPETSFKNANQQDIRSHNYNRNNFSLQSVGLINIPDNEKSIYDIVNENEQSQSISEKKKRSVDYEDVGEMYKSGNEERSPLYRRVNLLKKLLEVIRKSHKQENPEQDQYFQPFQTFSQGSQLKNRKISDSTYINDKYQEEYDNISVKNKTRNEDFKKADTDKKESENISYLPGEFYEMFGDLKIDSNVSLKDKERALEANGEVISQNIEMPKCTVSESKLKVTKKPENDSEKDNRIVERSTEKLKSYSTNYNYVTDTPDIRFKSYKLDDEISKEDTGKRLCLESSSSEDEPKDNCERLKNKLKKSTQEQKIAESNRESSRESALFGITLNRTVRDLRYPIKEALDLLTKSKRISNENINEYGDEEQINQLLEDLTNEGEQLLQSMDEEYEKHIAILKNKTGLSEALLSNPVTESVSSPHGKKDLIGNSTEEQDIYIANNILVDKIAVNKKKYPTKEEQLSVLLGQTKEDKSNTEIKEKVESSTETEEITQSVTSTVSLWTQTTPNPEQFTQTEISLMSEPELVNETNNTRGSITEAINNSDMYLESVIPQSGKTTKPSINFQPFTKTNSAKESETNKEDFLRNSNNITESPKPIPSPGESSIHTEGNYYKVIDSFLSKRVNPIGEHPTETYNKDSVSDSTVISYILATTENKTKENNSIKATTPTKGKTLDQKIKNLNSNLYTTSKPLLQLKTGEILDSQTKNLNSHLYTTLNPILQLKTKLSQISTVPSLKLDLSLQNRINKFNDMIKELNHKENIITPVLKNSPTLNLTVNRNKERLEAIREKLKNTRERLLNLTLSKLTSTLPPIQGVKTKREINLGKNIFNDFVSTGIENGEKRKSEKNHFESNNSKNKVKYLEDLLTGPATLNDFDLISRLRRQVYGAQNKYQITDAQEEHIKSAETDKENKNNPKLQMGNNIVVPSYVPAIRKWVVPLGNDTENIVFENELVPVKLYGILSNKWMSENYSEKTNSVVSRQARALHYPCVKGHLDDLDLEEGKSIVARSSGVENVGAGYVGNSKDTLHPYSPTTDHLKHNINLKSNQRKIASNSNTPKEQSSRIKRSLNEDITKNEMEMKALLTNEIVKEKPTYDDSDHDSAFNTMLHKTLKKTVSNKTGIERMLELAKEYKKNNPSSIELFTTKDKKNKGKKYMEKILDKSEEENKALEIVDNAKDINSIYWPTKEKFNSTELNPNTTSKSKNGIEHSMSNEESLRKLNESSLHFLDKNPNNEWAALLDKIKSFFDSIEHMIRAGLS